MGAFALATIAGAYFLYGTKDAPKNRKKIQSWMLKAQGEVLEKLEKARVETEAEYKNIIDTVLRKYSALKSVDTKEVEKLGKDLKRHWKSFQSEIKKVRKA